MAEHTSLLHLPSADTATYTGRWHSGHGFAEFEVSNSGDLFAVYDDDPARLAAGLRAAADAIERGAS